MTSQGKEPRTCTHEAYELATLGDMVGLAADHYLEEPLSAEVTGMMLRLAAQKTRNLARSAERLLRKEGYPETAENLSDEIKAHSELLDWLDSILPELNVSLDAAHQLILALTPHYARWADILDRAALPDRKNNQCEEQDNDKQAV